MRILNLSLTSSFSPSSFLLLSCFLSSLLCIIPINAILLQLFLNKSVHYGPYDIMIIIREEGYHKIHVASINPFFQGYISQIVFISKMRWDNRVFGFYFNESSSEIQIIEFLINSLMTALIFSAKWKVIFLRLGVFFNLKHFWLTKQW